MAQNPMFNEAAFERARQEQQGTRAQNPLQEETFAREGFTPRFTTAGQTMTLQGTINKTFTLLALCIAGGVLGWSKAAVFGNGTLLILALAALAIALWTSFKPSVSAVTAPIYALLEGVLLGVISAWYNVQYHGIVLQAVEITVLVFGVMLVLYKTGIVKVTQKFATAVVSATVAIAIFYLISLVITWLGGDTSYLTSSSPLSIGISVVVCIVAALNLMLDFQFIAVMTSRPDTPKFMEWYAGFGLLVTIVWLYIEILRLLAKSKRR